MQNDTDELAATPEMEDRYGPVVDEVQHKHTPGPLTICGPSDGKGPFDDGGDYAILDSDQEVIGEAICQIDYSEFRPAEANARLWAAAPELLAACELIAESGRKFNGDWDSIHQLLVAAHRAAKAAIAKARGKECGGA